MCPLRTPVLNVVVVSIPVFRCRARLCRIDLVTRFRAQTDPAVTDPFSQYPDIHLAAVQDTARAIESQIESEKTGLCLSVQHYHEALEEMDFH
jgi:hypothetical protein